MDGGERGDHDEAGAVRLAAVRQPVCRLSTEARVPGVRELQQRRVPAFRHRGRAACDGLRVADLDGQSEVPHGQPGESRDGEGEVSRRCVESIRRDRARRPVSDQAERQDRAGCARRQEQGGAYRLAVEQRQDRVPQHEAEAAGPRAAFRRQDAGGLERSEDAASQGAARVEREERRDSRGERARSTGDGGGFRRPGFAIGHPHQSEGRPASSEFRGVSAGRAQGVLDRI